MGGSLEARSSRPAWLTWRNPVCTKNIKISWVWWQAPVVPAIWESEAENCLNLGSGGCSELRPCHSTSAGATERDSVPKKERKISQVWWCAPVIPATQKTEAESLEPGRRRLQ